jgi:3-(3-hydroxy-phenyl)propionate hydroxylase
MTSFTPVRPDYDVAIVGLGPVGATLGNLLAMRGLSVLILDREPNLYALPRAVQFDGECMRLFQTIGIAEPMRPNLLAVPGMLFLDAQGKLLIDWSRPMHTGPQGWFASYRFHQPDLEETLRRQLTRHDNVDIRLRHEVFALEQTANHVALRFEDKNAGQLLSTRAQYVVGCDGARSTVRRCMGTSLEDLKSHDRWLVLDVLLNRERPDLGDYAIQYCGSERPATYIRGIGMRRRWEFMLPADVDLATIDQPETVWPMLSRWVTPEEASIERSAVYTFHSVIATGWRQGRLLIAGDAAHQTPPFMGQGMCAGVRDAANLAWKLADVMKGVAHESLLDSYESERAPHARVFIEAAVRLGKVISDTGRASAAGDEASPRELEKFTTPEPRLGAGAHEGTGYAGRVSEQPVMAGGGRLDDGVGYESVLLVSPALAEAATLFGRVVVADSPNALDYLARLDCEAVLIRPDRYIFGTASRLSEVEGMVRRFREMAGALDTV